MDSIVSVNVPSFMSFRLFHLIVRIFEISIKLSSVVENKFY